jgi:pimeloyl-ACP methyl ester carboxylesterase
METVSIETAEGRFTAFAAGPADGQLVLLLHGFPQSRHAWRDVVPALAARGYRAIAPDQRGYSPGARPDPSVDLSAYAIDRLVADVLDIAAALEHGDRRFHLVGHDWGGQVAWAVAGWHPERLASLSVLSRPHPAAFRRAFEADAEGQQKRSGHHRAFHDPATAELLLEDGARRLRAALSEQGVGDAAIEEYLSVLGTQEALEAALAWYRAAGALTRLEVGVIEVPTLYVWGDADATVGRTAAEGTEEFVRAAYRFEVLPRVGHFVTDQAAGATSELIARHLASI